MFDLEFKPYLLTFLWSACLALVLWLFTFVAGVVFGGIFFGGLLVLAAGIGFFVAPPLMALRRLLREKDGLYTGRMAWRFALQATGLTLLVILPVLLLLLVGGSGVLMVLSDTSISELWDDRMAREIIMVVLAGLLALTLVAVVVLALVCRAVFWIAERRILG